MTPLEDLEQYQVSPTTGFLPAEPPLERLPEYCNAWEAICSDLPKLIAGNQLADAVSALPLLSAQFLTSEPEYRRAYVILGFIASGLLWGSERTVDRIPASISVPFQQVSDYLDIPPYATLAGENFWNYKVHDASKPISDPDNLAAQFTFTGTDDESWFFIVLTAMEAKAAPIIPLALEAFEAVSKDDALALIDCLKQIADHIHGLSLVLPRMYERNDPQFFYNRIRPLLAGCKASAELPNGVFYENEYGGGSWREYTGPNATQSSLWQFIDLALGVKHLPTGTTSSNYGNVVESTTKLGKHQIFQEEMRQYMPGPHRRFLEKVAEEANVRTYITAHPDNADLQAAYNSCLERLVAFRNKHVQIVSRYVVIPSRVAQCKHKDAKSIIDVSKSSEAVKAEAAALGTGGTSPVVFLKQVRNETRESLIPA